MKRSLIFAKRNFKEIVRDPLSLLFNFVFPLVMLVLFFFFIFGKDGNTIKSQTPMFIPYNIVPAIGIFSFSFLTLFGGMLVSKDKASSLTSRLKISPLKPYEFFLGYSLPLFLIALLQIIVTYLFGWALSFGISDSLLRFNPWSFNALLSIIVDIPIAIFFISAGIFFGVIVNEKTIGGISSLLVNLAGIMSGMFMPLATMGVFKNICQFLPFVHSVNLATSAVTGKWANDVSFFDETIEFYKKIGMNVSFNILDTWWMGLIIVFIYSIVMSLCSILVFKKKMQADD